MFKIKPNQLAACAEVSTQSFVDKVTRRLVEALPEKAAEVGSEAIQKMVEEGIARAASLGITAEQDVCLFLAASSALASSFGAAPDLSRVTDLLGAENPLDVASKVRQLWSVVESEVLPEGASQGSPSETEGSAAIAVELADAAKTDLASRLPVSKAVAPCPLRLRLYPFSI